MRVTWLADVLRGAGLTVVEHSGWKGRGKAMKVVYGVVLHHTATHPTALDETVCRILRDGRPDLPGPLCQVGLDRAGRWHLIADGKGNHNGHGVWANDCIGVEAFNDGISEPWPLNQIDSYQRGVAAILRHLGLDASHAKGHRETDPGRKRDPHGIDLDAFRKRVSYLLGDDDMTPEEHAWLGRVHHEVASGDTSGKTITQMLEELLRKVAALEAKVK